MYILHTWSKDIHVHRPSSSYNLHAWCLKLTDRVKQCILYPTLCYVKSLYSTIPATAVVPLSVHIAMLGVVMFFMGVTLGGLDNGKKYIHVHSTLW